MADETAKEFLKFVQSKPADEAYDYGEASLCAYAQFEKQAGCYEGPRYAAWCAEVGDLTLPDDVHEALVARPHTFGALAERLTQVPA